jgi:hypothetical protein
MPKITFIGAGSTVFTKNLLGDILSFPELADSHIALMDIDAERQGDARRSAAQIETTALIRRAIAELPEERAQKIERHLLRCPACAYEARTLEQTRALLRESVQPAEASPAFRERTVARLLDTLAPYLRPESETPQGRQWTLPLLSEE